jgi:hypothetical protein
MTDSKASVCVSYSRRDKPFVEALTNAVVRRAPSASRASGGSTRRASRAVTWARHPPA